VAEHIGHPGVPIPSISNAACEAMHAAHTFPRLVVIEGLPAADPVS
jgi:hypothetical protein